MQNFSSPEKDHYEDHLKRLTYNNMGEEECYEESEEDSSLYQCPKQIEGGNAFGERRPFSPPFKQLS